MPTAWGRGPLLMTAMMVLLRVAMLLFPLASANAMVNNALLLGGVIGLRRTMGMFVPCVDRNVVL